MFSLADEIARQNKFGSRVRVNAPSYVDDDIENGLIARVVGLAPFYIFENEDSLGYGVVARMLDGSLVHYAPQDVAVQFGLISKEIEEVGA